MSRIAIPLPCLLLFGLIVAPSVGADDCGRRLDAALAERDEAALSALATDCFDHRDVLHNLGVQAANASKHDEAMAFFEQALTLDPMAEASYDHLQTLHRYRAVTAYREALESSLGPPVAPVFDYRRPALRASEGEWRERFSEWWTNQCTTADCKNGEPPAFRVVSLAPDTVALLYQDAEQVRGPVFMQTREQWRLAEEAIW